MKKSIVTYIVDSFTDQLFKGNPAGVCLLNQELANRQMQDIAKELGFSETAFMIKIEDSEIYAIRFFSPVMEIPLCGHATLASSKVLFEINPDLAMIHFKNIEDLDLTITKNGNKIEMDFPIYDTVPQTAANALLKALGINKVSNSEFNKELNIVLLEIESCKTLSELSPDFEKLKRSKNDINGVVVTAISKRNNYDFESRYFWPWSGSNEDPVTGGTHTFLAKYWGKRLNKIKMNSYQCSERTGFMEVELITAYEMKIRGEAQIVLKGELWI